MLQGINRIGQSWVGKVGVAIMFGFLIISFGIWGVGDIFRGRTDTTVATVGRADISSEAYRVAYQNELQRIIQRVRRNITPDQARALGLDNRVLGRLVTEAAFDQRVKALGLSVSDALVVRTIQSDPNFRGPGGSFDRTQFGELLRSSGLTELQYVRDQRAVMARLQLAEAVTGALGVPIAMREAVHRFQTEKRAAEYIVLGPAVLGDLPAATEAQLQAYFDGHKTGYRAPEYRTLDTIVLDPAAIAKPGDVSDADARKFYDAEQTRFGTPERRTIEQIVFPNRAEADAASARVKEGASFDTIATERGLDPKTLGIGSLTRSEMIDPAAAEAAFSLAEGGVGGPVESPFGTQLLRVTAVRPGNLRPFAEVAAEARLQVALTRARDQIGSVHDAIENDRASGKALAEIARERSMRMLAVPAVNRQGAAPSGEPVAGLPEPAAVAGAAFQSDIGADTEALPTREGGYVWFEVKKVEPARDRTLAEVKDKAAADWRAEQVTTGLGDRAREVTERLAKGEALQTVAAELGLTVQMAADLGRNATSSDLTAAAVPRVFATPVGKVASVSTTDDKRVVFRVTDASVPPFVTTTQQAGNDETQLRGAVSDDLLAEYVAEIQKELGVSVNPDMMRRAIGGET